MYEKLYLPIPDIGAYLERLQITGSPRRDKAYLNQLIYAHQCRIIFENLDVCEFHRPVSLEIPDLFQKIIVRKRGGYCFELNGLFTQLLRDLGYRAYSCMCRIVRGKDFTAPILHRGIIVSLDDDLYYCDVGYGGPQPPGAVPIRDGSSTEFANEAFHIQRYDDYWWTLARTTSSGSREDVIRFYTMPQDYVDFITLNEYSSHSPASVFTQKRFINMRTKAGSRNITGNVYTCTEHGQTTTQSIQNDEEFRKILADVFGLRVSTFSFF